MKDACFGSVLVVMLVLAGAASVHAAAPDLDWADVYGDTLRDVGYWIEEHSSQGYLVSGYADFGLTGISSACLMRLNPAGDTLWTRTYWDTVPGAVVCVQETHDGGCILAGYIERVPGNLDALFIRTDANGDTLWTSSFDFGGNDVLYRVLETPDSGFIATGFISPPPVPGTTDVLVLRIDGDGNGVWKTICGGPGHNRGYDICEAGDGDYVVSGYTETATELANLLLIKFEADSGDSLWAKTYGDTAGESGRSIEATHDGGLVVAGSKTDYGLDMIAGYIVRTDAGGDSLWTRVYRETSAYISLYSLALTADNGFICSGYYDTSSTGNSDCYFLKTDADGNVQWTKEVGKDPREAATSVTVTSDLGYASTGYSRELPGEDFNFIVVKLGEDDAGADPVEGLRQPLLLSVDGANPFTSTVPVRFELAATSHVSLAVYDVEGRQVALLADAVECAGSHRAVWDLRNASGSLVPSGVYFIRCAASGLSGVQKVIVLR